MAEYLEALDMADCLLGLHSSAMEPTLPSGFYLKPNREPYAHSMPDLADELVTQLLDVVAKPRLPRTRITPTGHLVAA